MTEKIRKGSLGVVWGFVFSGFFSDKGAKFWSLSETRQDEIQTFYLL